MNELLATALQLVLAVSLTVLVVLVTFSPLLVLDHFRKQTKKLKQVEQELKNLKKVK